MAIALVDNQNKDFSTNQYYLEEDYTKYLQISVRQTYYDNEKNPTFSAVDLNLTKCTADNLGLNGQEKSKFYPINEENIVYLNMM